VTNSGDGYQQQQLQTNDEHSIDSFALLNEITDYDKPLDDFYGDRLRHKEDDTLRFASHNINSFPSDSRGTMASAKLQRLKSIMLAGEFDVFALQELNKFWPDVDITERPKETLRRWFKSTHINLAYFKDCKHTKGKFLHGGTGIICLDDASSRS